MVRLMSDFLLWEEFYHRQRAGSSGFFPARLDESTLWHKPEAADAVVAAVADVEPVVGGDEDSMWPIQAAVFWLTVGSVSLLAIADDGLHDF